MNVSSVLRRRSPLAGLARRELPRAHVVAQSVSAVAPSAAMATTPALVAASAGRGAPVSVAIAAVVALLVASGITAFTRRMAAPGSLYTFTAKGLGPLAALVCAVALLIGYAFLAMAALVGFAQYAHALAVRVGWSALPAAPAVAGLVAVGSLGVASCVAVGARVSARVTLALEAVSIALVAGVLVVVLGHGGGLPGAAPLGLDGGGPAGIVAGVVPALAAFIGFESAAALGPEARRPFRTVSRAILGTVGVATALYLFATYAQVRHPGGGRADAARGWAAALDAGLATSFLACALAATTALTRLLFVLGREGVAPTALGRTHPARSTPHVAALCAAPVVAAVPCGLLALGRDPAQVFAWVMGMLTYGHMTAYLLVSVAAPVFLRRIGELTVPAVATAAVVVPVLVVVSATYSGSGAPGADGWVPVTFAGLLAAGLAGVHWLRTRAPHRLAAVGLYDETTVEDLCAAAESGGATTGVAVTASAARGNG
ncbi:APC family permease [Yinghuangia seranimata]|uniref:APC family permease n=1 Tax=Yinghuangia seranimata TaxID=408067 RepID=UPI00248ABC35|nr:APC family permease [Yinghuangia seranimata]MDI2132114.1 APC family permease [Yinghuangia seranimata]